MAKPIGSKVEGVDHWQGQRETRKRSVIKEAMTGTSLAGLRSQCRGSRFDLLVRELDPI